MAGALRIAPLRAAMISQALATVARHGRWCLVLGILAGLGLPGLTLILRPWVPYLISLLLFLAALRIGPIAAIGGFRGLGRSVKIVLLYQVAAPLVVLALACMAGVATTIPVLALVLVLAAPSVTGSPNFAILMGRDPSMAMRLLLVGTALFPLTALPVLLLLPGVGSAATVAFGALRLVAVIAAAVGLAFALRTWCLPVLRTGQSAALDGAAALVLGTVVIGLMSAVGPALRDAPLQFAGWLVFACAINFGAQILSARFLPGPARDRAATAIIAGNRNIALFLVALPGPVSDQLLLFIGCYQVPMYLTPMVMRFRT